MPIDTIHSDAENDAPEATTPSDRPPLKILHAMPKDADHLKYSGVTLSLDSNRNSTAQAATAAATPLDQLPLEARLKALVADPFDALPEEARRVRGRTRTGEEVAEAIPYPEIFLAEVGQMNEGRFFEINERGQLVMMDGCAEAYGKSETFQMAQMRQHRLVYLDRDGKIQVLAACHFTIDIHGNCIVQEGGEQIAARCILMERRLPKISLRGDIHGEEYARMNATGQFDKKVFTWTTDVLAGLDTSKKARAAGWNSAFGSIDSVLLDSRRRYPILDSRKVPPGLFRDVPPVDPSDSLTVGSRGVLTANLAFSD